MVAFRAVLSCFHEIPLDRKPVRKLGNCTRRSVGSVEHLVYTEGTGPLVEVGRCRPPQTAGIRFI